MATEGTATGTAGAARRPSYPYRSVADARAAAKAQTGGGSLVLLTVVLGGLTAWQGLSMRPGSATNLVMAAATACAGLVVGGLAVANMTRRWPADGSQEAGRVEAWNRVACQTVVAHGWAMAVASGGGVAVGVWASYVAVVGWPRAYPGVVRPAWVAGVVATGVAFGIAALAGNGAVRRLRDPHGALVRATAGDPAHHTRRVVAVASSVLGAALVVLGLTLPVSADGDVARPMWYFAGVLLGVGVLLLASGAAVWRQLAAGPQPEVSADTTTTPAATRTDPRIRGRFRLLGALALTVVATLVGIVADPSAGLAAAGYGVTPGVVAALGLRDVLVRARRQLAQS